MPDTKFEGHDKRKRHIALPSPNIAILQVIYNAS